MSILPLLYPIAQILALVAIGYALRADKPREKRKEGDQ